MKHRIFFIMALALCMLLIPSTAFAGTLTCSKCLSGATAIPGNSTVDLSYNTLSSVTWGSNYTSTSNRQISVFPSFGRTYCIKYPTCSAGTVKTLSDICTLNFTNVGKIGNRQINAKLYISSITLKKKTQKDFDWLAFMTIKTGSCTDASSPKIIYGSTDGGGEGETDAYIAGYMHVTSSLSFTWADTGQIVSLPFNLAMNDIDQVNSTTGMYEGVVLEGGDSIYTNPVKEWTQCKLTQSGNKLYAATDLNTSDNNCWYQGGFVATSKTGNMNLTSNVGGKCGMGFAVTYDWGENTIDNPTKTASPSSVEKGDKITWTVRQKLQNYQQGEMYTYYSSFVMQDTLKTGQQFVSATLLDTSGTSYGSVTSSSVSSSNSYGTLKYTASSRVISWTATSSWLQNSSIFNGRTMILSIVTTASISSGTITNQSSTTIDSVAQYYSNTAQVTVKEEETPVVTPSYYHIYYNANGGSNAPSTQTVIQGYSTKVSTTTPYKSYIENGTTKYYTFSGWSGSDGNTYQSGGTVKARTTDLTLTAIWKIIVDPEDVNYTITYNSNGGYFDTSTTSTTFSETKSSNSTYYISSKQPTRKNYGLLNWNTRQDGKGTTYKAGQAYYTEADLTLYAQWNSAPVITAPKILYIDVGTTFDPLKVATAYDAEDGNITSNLTVTRNKVNTNTPGIYLVGYSVTDSNNITTTQITTTDGKTQNYMEVHVIGKPTLTVPETAERGSTMEAVGTVDLMDKPQYVIFWLDDDKSNAVTVYSYDFYTTTSEGFYRYTYMAGLDIPSDAPKGTHIVHMEVVTSGGYHIDTTGNTCVVAYFTNVKEGPVYFPATENQKEEISISDRSVWYDGEKNSSLLKAWNNENPEERRL